MPRQRDAAADPGPLRIEVAVDSVVDAQAAVKAGAERVELCAALEVGGVTPGCGLLREVRAAIDGELVVLVRPRRGDFVYGEALFRALLHDVRVSRELGADGVAVGVLLKDGRLDRARMAELVGAAEGLGVTLHRAFDCIPDPLEALEQLVGLGVQRILTSGGAPSALEGCEGLQRLSSRAGDRIEIVAAGGVRSGHAAELVRRSGVRSLHASASRLIVGASPRRGAGTSLAPTCLPEEHERRRVDPGEVRALLQRAP